MTKAALVQMTSTDDPVFNLGSLSDALTQAAAQGAEFVLTPEVSNCLSSSRTHQEQVLRLEEEDQTLSAIATQAQALGVWVLLGSLAVKTGDADGRYANRSFLIGPEGHVKARYDKIHMFDVQVTPEETYRESDGYRPGSRAVVAQTPFGTLGLSICYDIRFPHLYQALAEAGAQILTIPAAFSPVTGAAHWHALLQARAIETGCYVLAPAQTGTHPTTRGKQRSTFGHSLVVSPWGEVLVDAGTAPGIHLFDLDVTKVAEARRRVPSRQNKRTFDGP